MRALHRATLKLFEDLSLQGVLQRVVAAAKELTHARYAALGIPDNQGGLQTFITLGMTEEDRAALRSPPKGKGLLGEMMRTGRTIRIPDISRHPKSVGFPPGHPQMRSFLGVPISAYGWPLGQIYLTDKEGASAFTEEDQRLIEMLAAHAAAAIENARLYHQVSDSQTELAQRNEELEAINQLTSAVSSGMDEQELVGVVLARVAELFAADAGEVYLREPGNHVYRLAAHQGPSEESFWPFDHFHRGEGLIGEVVGDGKPHWSSDQEGPLAELRPSQREAGLGTLMCVPLSARAETVGVLCLAFYGQRTINKQELRLLEAVGSAAGLAIENAVLNRRARRVAVLEERERIGMDLHDGIIQSIYAVGLTLESIRMLVEQSGEQAQESFDGAIASLNAVIRDIRTYILDLQPTRMLEVDLSKALERLLAEFRSNTGAEVELVTDPDAVSLLSQKVSAELFHIAQEALANVAKHAQATKVWVTLRQIEDEVLLQVIDNGRGFDLGEKPRMLGHGLSNMEVRATTIDGTCEVVSSPGEGTTISVSVHASKRRAEDEEEARFAI